MKNLRDRLSTRDKAYIKLALWSALLVWMAFLVAFAITGAIVLGSHSQDIWSGTMGDIMHYLLPIWFIYTLLLVIWMIARWATKRLKAKGEDE